MYYQNYEDYMRSVLGYPATSPNIYENYDYRTSFNMNNMAEYSPTYQDANQNMMSNLSEDDVRSLYPDIYHCITPMVDKVCKANREPITKELIEKMTDKIYMAMEEQPDIVVNIRAKAKKMPEDLGSSRRENETSSSNRKSLNYSSDDQKTENRTEKMGRRENVFAKKEELPQTSSKRAESSLKREESKQNSQSSPRENREISETRRRNFMLRDLIKILILNQLFGDRRPHHHQSLQSQRPPFSGRLEMPQARPPMGPRNTSNAKRLFRIFSILKKYET